VEVASAVRRAGSRVVLAGGQDTPHRKRGGGALGVLGKRPLFAMQSMFLDTYRASRAI
jgi:hypothetical protein